MKRDMDLIRKILLAAESTELGVHWGLSVDGYSQEQVEFHCYLLGEADLAEVMNTTHLGSSMPSARITRLTWQGYDFLDACRPPGRWQAAKAVMEKVGGAAFDIWKVVLAEVAKQNLGM